MLKILNYGNYAVKFHGLSCADMGSSLLLRVSCAGMGKQSAGKGFKKQVGQVETEIPY